MRHETSVWKPGLMPPLRPQGFSCHACRDGTYCNSAVGRPIRTWYLLERRLTLRNEKDLYYSDTMCGVADSRTMHSQPVSHPQGCSC
jgi:hypothetical protein